MKKIFLVIILIAAQSIAQKRTVDIFNFNEEEIKYSRIDCSKYGIAQIYVSMYTADDNTDMIDINATKFLKDKDTYYHTFYFFIEIPKKYSFAEKQVMFSEFIKHLENKENLKKYDLYINFDEDYSDKYQRDKLENKLENNVKRILLGLNFTNIVKALSLK